MNQEVLSQLRDIHLPPEPSWWPPAVGYYGVLVIFVAVFALSWWLFCWWRKRSRMQRYIKQECASIEQRFLSGGSVSEMQTELNWLVRRVALFKQQEKDKAARSEDLAKSMRHLFGNDERAMRLLEHLEHDRFRATNSLDGTQLLRLFKELMKTCHM